MRKIGIYLILVFLLPVFSGCSTTSRAVLGKDFDETKTKFVKKGYTSKNDLLQVLGEPHNKSLDQEGRERWVYYYSEGSYKHNYLGRSKGEIRVKKLLILFENDVVKNYVYSDTITPSHSSSSY